MAFPSAFHPAHDRAVAAFLRRIPVGVSVFPSAQSQPRREAQDCAQVFGAFPRLHPSAALLRILLVLLYQPASFQKSQRTEREITAAVPGATMPPAGSSALMFTPIFAASCFGG